MGNSSLRDHAMNQNTWKVFAAIVLTIGVLLTGCGRTGWDHRPMTPEVAVVAIQPQRVSDHGVARTHLRLSLRRKFDLKSMV